MVLGALDNRRLQRSLVAAIMFEVEVVNLYLHVLMWSKKYAQPNLDRSALLHANVRLMLQFGDSQAADVPIKSQYGINVALDCDRDVRLDIRADVGQAKQHIPNSGRMLWPGD